MNIKEHKFIIFSEEHYNPLGVVRSLGEKGIKPIAIIIKGNPVLTSKSKYLSKVHYVESREEGYQILLESYADENCPPFVYSCDDTTECFLDEHYNELNGKIYFFNAGSKGKVSEFLNKKNIGELAVKYGLNFLQSVVVKKGEIPEKIEYPVITKAIDSTVGGWKSDMFLCNNDNELKEAFEKISSPLVMIQKYIVKKNEYCLEGFSSNKGEELFISIESTYNYKLPMSYSPYMTVKNFSNRNNVWPSLKAMFKEIGFEGIFEIEFLESESGELYFGEINFRNSTWSYASTCAGMNLPILWAEAMLNGHQTKGCFNQIPEEGFKAMVELTDFKERVVKRKYPFYKWIYDLQKCKCKYYLGKRDLKPVFCMMWSRIITR